MYLSHRQTLICMLQYIAPLPPAAAAGLSPPQPVPALPPSGLSSTAAGAPQPANDGRQDFDFFVGKWKIRNRKLVGLFRESSEWEEFEGTAETQALLSGIGNMDEWSMPGYRPGFVGMSLRLFDPATRKWSTYETENRSGKLGPPLLGAFRDGIGIFEGQEEMDGATVLVRYTWTVLEQRRPKWQQAFSRDGGLSWEVNWLMEFFPIKN